MVRRRGRLPQKTGAVVRRRSASFARGYKYMIFSFTGLVCPAASQNMDHSPATSQHIRRMTPSRMYTVEHLQQPPPQASPHLRWDLSNRSQLMALMLKRVAPLMVKRMAPLMLKPVAPLVLKPMAPLMLKWWVSPLMLTWVAPLMLNPVAPLMLTRVAPLMLKWVAPLMLNPVAPLMLTWVAPNMLNTVALMLERMDPLMLNTVVAPHTCFQVVLGERPVLKVYVLVILVIRECREHLMASPAPESAYWVLQNPPIVNNHRALLFLRQMIGMVKSER